MSRLGESTSLDRDNKNEELTGGPKGRPGEERRRTTTLEFCRLSPETSLPEGIVVVPGGRYFGKLKYLSIDVFRQACKTPSTLVTTTERLDLTRRSRNYSFMNCPGRVPLLVPPVSRVSADGSSVLDRRRPVSPVLSDS